MSDTEQSANNNESSFNEPGQSQGNDHKKAYSVIGGIVLLVVVAFLVFLFLTADRQPQEGETNSEIPPTGLNAPLPEVTVTEEEGLLINSEKQAILEIVSSGKPLTEDEKERVLMAVSTQESQIKFNFSEEEKLLIIQTLNAN